MFDFSVYLKERTLNFQWHIGENFPILDDRQVIYGNVVIQVDGDELEYIEKVFGVKSYFRVTKITGDVAKNILINLAGSRWENLKRVYEYAPPTTTDFSET